MTANHLKWTLALGLSLALPAASLAAPPKPRMVVLTEIAPNMVIFSIGRDQNKRAYTGTNAACVFGFHGKAPGHEAIASFIEARLAAPFQAP